MYIDTQYEILSQVSWKVILRCLSLVRQGKLCSSDGWEPLHWLMRGSGPKALVISLTNILKSNLLPMCNHIEVKLIAYVQSY